MWMLKFDKHPLHFTRRRKRLCLISTFLVSILFVSYQFLIYYLLSSHKAKGSPKVESSIKGTHVQEKAFYTPVNGKFTCIKSGEVIGFEKVNDDYCDCADSSDEPGTNACPDGLFYCTKVSTNKKYPKMVPSSKVNDGICDCCDGSEEYHVQHLLGHQQKANNLLAMCPNNC